MDPTLEELIESASNDLAELSARSREVEQKLIETEGDPEERYWLLEWAHIETMRDYARDELTSLIF